MSYGQNAPVSPRLIRQGPKYALFVDANGQKWRKYHDTGKWAIHTPSKRRNYGYGGY